MRELTWRRRENENAGLVDSAIKFKTQVGDIVEKASKVNSNRNQSNQATKAKTVIQQDKYNGQTCSQVSEVQVQVKSQVSEVKSKSSLKSLKRSPSQVLSL